MQGFRWVGIFRDLPMILKKPIIIPLITDEKGRLFARHKRRRSSRKGNVKESSSMQSFSMHGEVKIGPERQYTIQGKEFSIGPETWIVGKFEIGALAKVRGTVNHLGKPYATSIVVTKEKTTQESLSAH